MSVLDWIAAAFAFILLAIPLYWFILHPFASFWRTKPVQLAFAVAATVAWGISLLVMLALGSRPFAISDPPFVFKILGVVLLLGEVLMMRQVLSAMGPERLAGKMELSGMRELQVSGVYAYVRHPSYAGMMGAMLGVCLLAWSAEMWVLGIIWFLAMRLMIALEERELIARFGEQYVEYQRKVPAFLPYRF